MNIQAILISFILLFSPALSFAHIGGHAYLLTDEEVIPVAKEHVAFLIQEGQEIDGAGKLDPAWNKVSKSHKKVTKYEGFYIVSFEEPKLKKTFYLLLAATGDLYGINDTGIFEDLDQKQ